MLLCLRETLFFICICNCIYVYKQTSISSSFLSSQPARSLLRLTSLTACCLSIAIRSLSALRSIRSRHSDLVTNLWGMNSQSFSQKNTCWNLKITFWILKSEDSQTQTQWKNERQSGNIKKYETYAMHLKEIFLVCWGRYERRK